MSYAEVPPARLAEIVNGCGPKGGWLKPPQFIFTASCNQHDYYYWVGGTEHDRWEADWAFYLIMRQDAREYGWKRWWYYTLAWTYYKAVRLFGRSSFHFGSKRSAS